jgi:plastocyanin domain-containing protein
MDKIVVVIASIGLAGLILWWFFGKHPAAAFVATQQDNLQLADITVRGGYNPGVVKLRRGIPAKLTFLRKDTSSCLEEVIMPDFGVSEKLPVNRPHAITIHPDKAGEYTYSCGMRMYFGKVIVK